MTAESAAVWTFLRDVRRRRRRARRGRIAYALYVAALAVAIYGGPLVVRGVHSVEGPGHPTEATHRIVAGLPLGLTTLWLLVLLALLRQSTWRGPILLSAADADWLLTAPLSRTKLLRPRLTASLLTGAALAAVAGFIAALVLHGYGVAALGRLWLPLIAAALFTVAIGMSLGALVERFVHASRVVVRWSPAIAVVALAFGAVTVARVAGASLGRLQSVILWSGPWGWCSQMVVQVNGETAAHWPVAAGLTVAAAVLSVLVASAAMPAVPARALRQRAATANVVNAALFLGETRDARLGVREGRRLSLSHRRLPLPHRSWLALPWRDATSLVRAPAAIAWALLGLGTTGVVLRIAADHDTWRHAIVPLAIAMVAGYATATQLVEPARLDADDTRRTRWSPYPAARHARWHAVVPALSLVIVGVVAGLVATPWLDLRRTTLTLAAAILIAPALVAAALVGAYRGRVPLELMLGGVDIGFGPTGPLLLILWYLYGPLAAIAAGQLILGRLVAAWHGHTSVAPPILGALAFSLAISAVLYGWAGSRARKLTHAP